jgi:pyridoxal phosphate enzyme (YggS family)
MTQFSVRLSEVNSRIFDACQRFGRNPGEITLLAVSKRHPVTAIREAAGCGQRHFGENFVQEALEKIEALRGLDIVWHFIGHLQSNKTRAAAENFAWVHSLDREKIARRLSDQRPFHAPPLNVCLQVCLEEEPGKGGVMPEQIPALAATVAGLPRIRLRGLMAIPPPADDFALQRGYFRRLRELFDELKAAGLQIDTLSMGMTGDMEAAVAEGSTILRIGTALFGPRPRTGGA